MRLMDLRRNLRNIRKNSVGGTPLYAIPSVFITEVNLTFDMSVLRGVY